MANNTVHTITLSGYTATAEGNCWALQLGTWDSYGIEQIQLKLGQEWAGLVITATFTPPKGRKAVKVVVDSSGLFDVPQEATAFSGQGTITFAANTSGQQRISVDAPYVVANHAAIDGVTPTPTPSEWAQFVAQVQQARDDAEAAAQAAEDSQTAAAGSASAAAESAQEAQNIVDGAVQDITDAKNAAVQAVNDAGNAKIEQIEQINALVPTPTPEDAGKVIVVKPDGTGYELGDVQTDSYTKAESDARYAPIASALKVKCNGTGIGTLTPTVLWWLQDLLIGGRTTQDGTPTSESSVPLVNAGQDGEISAYVAEDAVYIPGYSFSQKAEFSIKFDGEDVIFNRMSGVQTWTDNACNVNLSSGTYILECESVEGEATSTSTFVMIRETKNYTSIATLKKNKLKEEIAIEEGKYKILILSASNVPDSPFRINKLRLYKQIQPFTIPTPNGLPGIPVDSGGNWTDENGQQWVCDTIDRETGLWTHRVSFTQINPDKIYAIDSVRQTNPDYYGIDYRGLLNELKGTTAYGVLCDISTFVGVNRDINGDELMFAPGNGIMGFGLKKSLVPDGTLESVKAYFTSNPCTFCFANPSPSTTQLSEAELAALNALQSYDGTTNIVVPDAMVRASAVADATEYINQQIANAIAIAKA